ncbi:MAG: peptide deformylase [SAR324 cluster bacterium]|nr:peptide deformylase [SAR324 cluster bacterium]
MAVMKIYTFPDKVLKQVAEPVTTFDTSLRELAESMLETMYESEGIGLAANQVGILQRIIVIDINSGNEDTSTREPYVLINPVIEEKSGDITYEEGCLSVVEYRAEVPRFRQIKVAYQDLEGKPQTMNADELKAVCLQHELDHLDGILFIDHLPLLKQKMVKKHLKKQARLAEEASA